MCIFLDHRYLQFLASEPVSTSDRKKMAAPPGTVKSLWTHILRHYYFHIQQQKLIYYTSADQDAEFPYALIGRVKLSQCSGAMVLQVKADMVQHFHGHFTAYDMKYVWPYFIIRLRTIQSRRYLLSLRILHGSRFTMYIAPWCSEYHTCDLPWMVPYNPLGTLKLSIYILLFQPANCLCFTVSHLSTDDPTMESTIITDCPEAPGTIDYLNSKHVKAGGYIGAPSNPLKLSKTNLYQFIHKHSDYFISHKLPVQA